jgi:hypothetical protein
MTSYFSINAMQAFDNACYDNKETAVPTPKSSEAARLAVIRGAPPNATAQHVSDTLSWLGLNVEQMMPSEGLLEGGVAVVLFASEDDVRTCLALDATEGLAIFDSCGWRWPLSCERAYSQNNRKAEEAKGNYKLNAWTSPYEPEGMSNCIPPWPPASNATTPFQTWLGSPLDHSNLCEPLNLSLLGGLQQHISGDQFKLPDAQIQDNASDATDRSTRTPDSKQETLDQDSVMGSPGNARGRGRWKSPGYGPNLAERYRCKDVPVTTMMIRNIPCRFRQAELMSIIDGMGFEKTYDFFYLPMDSRKNANLGYAFVNFENAEVAEQCRASLDKYTFKTTNSSKACMVKAADIQGIFNLKHYRKSILNPTSFHKPFYKVPEGFQWSMIDEN